MATIFALADVVKVASYTLDPLIDEVIKVSPLVLLLRLRNIRHQWSLTDCILIGASLGSGFGLAEALFRFSTAAGKATEMPFGWVFSIGLSPVTVFKPMSLITTWLPESVSIGEIFFTADTPKRINLHLAWIHWPTTARRNSLYTRVMESAPAHDWWIVLDAEENAQVGHDWESTLELGVILAMSLADRGFRARHSVGLLASGDQTIWLKPKHDDENHRMQMTRALSMLKPGHLSLSDLLARAGPTLGQRTSLIIITSSLNSDWLTPLTSLMWRGIIPTILIMDPASFGSPNQSDSFSEI